MKAIKAITLSLGELDAPVISKYQFGLVVYHIYRHKVYKGKKVALQKDFAEQSDVASHLDLLLDEGVLSPLKGLPHVYTLLGRSSIDAADVACTVDPFCYLSHLSAMSYHGLTDRIPGKLFISSPAQAEWKHFAAQHMQKDLGSDYERYLNNGLPALTRTKIQKINRTEVHCLNSKHWGAYKKIKDRSIRVSTIGRTFLEMLKNPELCGGINHVIDVYEEYAKKYLRLITDDIDKNGAPIDKVRAGYILNERLGISNETIESWTAFAQRGGSRKLDASAEYIPEWSDKWAISINIFRNGPV